MRRDAAGRHDLPRGAGAPGDSMGLVAYVQADGDPRRVDVPDGDTLMRGAVDNMIEGIIGECGGGLACATCHCYVGEEWAAKMPPPSKAEIEMLESAACEVKSTSRLSCQITVTDQLDGIVVQLPASQY